MKDAYVLKFNWVNAVVKLIILSPIFIFSVVVAASESTPHSPAVAFLGFVVWCLFLFMIISDRKRKIVIDEKGITSKKINVKWSEVVSCERDNNTRNPHLIVYTYDGSKLSDELGYYSYKIEDLARAIDHFAGRKVFNLERRLLDRRYNRAAVVGVIISTLLFWGAIQVFVHYYLIRNQISTIETMLWCGLIGALLSLSTCGYYYYLKHWRRKNNYYHD